jgi:hypothetical protein
MSYLHKEYTPKERVLHLPPKRGLPIGNIGLLISNAKASAFAEQANVKIMSER